MARRPVGPAGAVHVRLLRRGACGGAAERLARFPAQALHPRTAADPHPPRPLWTCDKRLMLVALVGLLCAAAPETVKYVPRHEELKYTFGGHPPVMHLKPGTRLVSWTEDCFDGAVTRPGQLPTKVVPPGHDNPQPGPFYVDGAEPGDTIAIHIEKLSPARPQGLSSFFPGFGALNGTDRTAVLGPDLPETVWFYD